MEIAQKDIYASSVTFLILLDAFHGFGIEEHTAVVSAGCDEHRPVLVGLHVHDGLPVVGLELQFLLGLDVPLDEISVVVASQEEILQASPQHGGHLGTVGRDGHFEDWLLGTEGPGVDHLDLTGITHLLVSGETDLEDKSQ